MSNKDPNSFSQPLHHHLELPAQFTSWNQFYDELTRLGLIQPTTTLVRIKVFQATDSVKDDSSISIYLSYERHHIERMCLEELRQERLTQFSYLLTSQEIEHLIRVVSNLASRLTDWDLLLKLNELLRYQQQQEKKLSNIHMESGQ